MNLELNLMELNSLYVAVSNQLKAAKQEAKQYPSTFFDKQLVIAEELVEKIQTALWNECTVLDEVVAEAHQQMVDDLELEREKFEYERNFYASISDWDMCELLNDTITEIDNKISKYNY
jgi:hypothetical protein